MEKKTQPPVSREEYEALIAPVRPRSQADLFDYQVERLVAMNLMRRKHADPFRKKIPKRGLFLLVPPEPSPAKLDLEHLMSLVELHGVKGVNYLNRVYLKNLIKVPTGPVLLTDVEDGRARLNVKPSVSREQIKVEGRHAYTTWRGIIHLVLFPEILRHHNLDLVASKYKSDYTPLFCLNDSESKLDVDWNDDAHPRWGAPSAGSVIVA